MIELSLDSLDGIKLLLLVSFGAILGSNVRFFIFNSLDEFFIKKQVKIILINNLASFLLGFFSAIINNNSLDYSSKLGSLIIIGFLGSLSTFSTYIYDLFELSCSFQFSKMIRMLLSSIIFGLLFLSIGVFVGNQ